MTIDVINKTAPKDWQRVKLGDISRISNGRTNAQDAVVDGAYPLFDRSINTKKSNKYLFDGTAIILPGEGAEFIPRFYSGKFDLHQRAYAIFPNEKTDPRFLFQYLHANRSIFAKNAVGSTVKSLRLPIMQAVPVILPPIYEQKKIGEILSTVDNEIQKVDEIITATEKLKGRLMLDLFTKGIGHTKFKKSRIGEIPEEWDVITIKEASVELIDGDRGVNYPKLLDFSSEGYCLFLSNKNIKEDKFLFLESQFISEDKDASLRKGKLQKYDVVLTTRGTVGNVAFYDDEVPFKNIRINSGMLLLRASGRLNHAYLYHLMKSPLLKKKYAEMASGSAQPQLPIRSLEHIFLPIPPEKEQRKIVEISVSFDAKITNARRIREKLSLLKEGLMQDLLSGKVRINV